MSLHGLRGWFALCNSRLLLGALCLLCSVTWAAPGKHKAKAASAWGETAAVRELAQELAREFDLPETWALQRIAHARPLPQIRQLVLPPASPSMKNWAAYRHRFIEPRRIQAGVQFWRQNAQALQRAEQRFGVPAELVVGIIGVETLYGQHQGKFPVLDVLTTLSLDFPSEHPRAAQRQAFFRAELGHFLRQVRAGASIKRLGSFAGAMGWPQFMPSSWSRHAIDFDGDGRIDLNRSPVDAIGSVAQYFVNHGWQSGMPTHFQVDVSDPSVVLEILTGPDIVPTFSAERMAELGARLEPKAQAFEGPLALIELQNGGASPSYVVGTSNFYVVTRYNWSSYYALAVIELGQAVKAEINGAGHNASQPSLR